MNHVNKFKEYKVYDHLIQVLSSIDETRSRAELGSDFYEKTIKVLNRAESLLIQLRKMLKTKEFPLSEDKLYKSISPRLISLDRLLNEPFYVNVENQVNLVNNELELLYLDILEISVYFSEYSLEGLQKLYLNLGNSMKQQRESFESRFNALNSELLSTSKKQKELNGMLSEQGQDIRIVNEEVEQLIIGFQKEFQSTQRKALEESTELKEKVKLMITSIESRQEDFLNTTNTNQEKYDEEIGKHKKSVEELVGIISTNSISAHFKDVANDKRKKSHLWQAITILGFLLTIGFGIYSFIYQNTNLNIYEIMARIIVTIALGSFTGYVAVQASNNEKEEKVNRRMEVELKTLNPYIANFSDKEQLKFKEQYFPHVFGVGVDKTGNLNEHAKEDN